MQKRIKTEIIIDASLKQVWDLLTDVSRYPEWNTFLIAVEGKLTKGGRLKNGSKTFIFKPVVKSVTEYQSLSWLGSLGIKGLFDGLHYFHLEELAPGQVKLTHVEYFSGLLSAVILKKIAVDTRANFVSMNQALKLRAELFSHSA